MPRGARHEGCEGIKKAAARPLYERALSIFTAKLGPEHPHTRTTRNNLARLGQ
ncbi:MAG: tetratricopeptide repeat protein [Chloroflexi bacterium]|nr:tetratricopeptide repeat protein [Chloroflexota bacterium]